MHQAKSNKDIFCLIQKNVEVGLEEQVQANRNSGNVISNLNESDAENEVTVIPNF